MTAPETVSQRIIDIVARERRVPPETVTLDTAFRDVGFDSLDLLNVVFALEEEFKVSISDEAAVGIRTIRDAVQGIETLLAEKGPPPLPV